MNPRVVTQNGLTIDLSQVIAFKQSLCGKASKNVLVELKIRHEYIKHPDTDEWILLKFNDTIEQECSDYETARVYIEEWKERWQSYLEDQS
jgi:hypothetical protein